MFLHVHKGGIMRHPLFSCVIPVKGARPYLADALASLSSQGIGDDLEIIIQDGDVEPDKGQSDALNRGFAKAHGDWLFWLNADDILLPNALKRVKNCICLNPSAQWIAGNAVYMNSEGYVRWCVWDCGWRSAYWNLQVQVYGPSSFFHRRLLESAGLFDISLNYAMDVDMWCRFRKTKKWYVKVPYLIWGFRLHRGSKTAEAQEGHCPPYIAAEVDLIAERYGLSMGIVANIWARFLRCLNGSYFHSFFLTWLLRGKSAIEIGKDGVLK